MSPASRGLAGGPSVCVNIHKHISQHDLQTGPVCRPAGWACCLPDSTHTALGQAACLFMKAYTQIKQNLQRLWIPIWLINFIQKMKYRLSSVCLLSNAPCLLSLGQPFQEFRGGGLASILAEFILGIYTCVQLGEIDHYTDGHWQSRCDVPTLSLRNRGSALITRVLRTTQ